MKRRNFFGLLAALGSVAIVSPKLLLKNWDKPFSHIIDTSITGGSKGNPLDTTSAERAVRRVHEKLENILFTNVRNIKQDET